MPYTPVPYEYTPGRRATNADTVPGTPSGVAERTPSTSQLTIIGGFTDAFHFYPVIVHGNAATIYPHNNLLAYGRTYYVQIDPGVLTLAGGGFTGVSGKRGWTFSTKAEGAGGRFGAPRRRGRRHAATSTRSRGRSTSCPTAVRGA